MSSEDVYNLPPVRCYNTGRVIGNLYLTQERLSRALPLVTENLLLKGYKGQEFDETSVEIFKQSKQFLEIDEYTVDLIPISILGRAMLINNDENKIFREYGNIIKKSEMEYILLDYDKISQLQAQLRSQLLLSNLFGLKPLKEFSGVPVVPLTQKAIIDLLYGKVGGGRLMERAAFMVSRDIKYTVPEINKQLLSGEVQYQTQLDVIKNQTKQKLEGALNILLKNENRSALRELARLEGFNRADRLINNKGFIVVNDESLKILQSVEGLADILQRHRGRYKLPLNNESQPVIPLSEENILSILEMIPQKEEVSRTDIIKKIMSTITENKITFDRDIIDNEYIIVDKSVRKQLREYYTQSELRNLPKDIDGNYVVPLTSDKMEELLNDEGKKLKPKTKDQDYFIETTVYGIIFPMRVLDMLGIKHGQIANRLQNDVIEISPGLTTRYKRNRLIDLSKMY